VGNAFDQAIMDPSETTGVIQRYKEGQTVSQLIVYLLATRRVADVVDGRALWRAARASDFLLLVKRRAYFPQYERALREAGLAYESSRLGGLFNTLEIDDLLALLTTLVTPRHDLPLAQVLRSPLFGFTEAQMQQLTIVMTTGHYVSWWDALQDSPDVFLQRAARYLKHWQILGEHLPVHDLLDRIYQESDIRMKYATVSPELTRPQVLANLDAFLELALKQDGGRYPSLSRFVEQMNAMRRGEDDETPDEGEVDAEPNDHFFELDEDAQLSEEDRNKRVRLMTIHGAKGLEAPFVIVLDANHTNMKTDYGGVLVSWEPGAKSPAHLSLFTSKLLTSPRLEIDAAEKQINEKENWNLLYVAMTRARQGLWLSGVAQKSTQELNQQATEGANPLSWFGKANTAGVPVFPLAELATTESWVKVIEKTPSQQALPSESATEFSIEDFVLHWQPAQESHIQRLQEIETGNTVPVFHGVALSEQDQTDPELLEEGVHFHKVLEHLTDQTGVHHTQQQMTVQELAQWLDLDQSQAQKALERALRVMSTETLKKYLCSGEWLQAWNEMDLINTEGHSFRLDRLVEFDDHLAILDYKLTIPEKGTEQLLKYQMQLKNYQTELTRIRPDKPNKAYLVSATGQIQLIE
jgi:ATP-dependent helicase/nuclease subunit A